LGKNRKKYGVPDVKMRERKCEKALIIFEIEQGS
jgi:hypothetical protein